MHVDVHVHACTVAQGIGVGCETQDARGHCTGLQGTLLGQNRLQGKHQTIPPLFRKGNHYHMARHGVGQYKRLSSPPTSIILPQLNN